MVYYKQDALITNFHIYIADCLPYVAERGSVGASGDLAPLSHLILGLMGEGQMWSPKTGWGPAAQVKINAQNLMLLIIIGSQSEQEGTHYIESKRSNIQILPYRRKFWRELNLANLMF